MIFIQLIDAFTYLEKNKIIHRDIREQNILIAGINKIKIIDFGLGKIIPKVENNTDTFNSIINRNGMAVVPEEFEKGQYDSKTDMFCIAELLKRLIDKNNIDEFKYAKILNKMMNVNVNKRYSSFKIIKDEINSKKLSSLTISESDKQVYRKFTDSLKDAISKFIKDPNFVYDVNQIMDGLESVIKRNFLEEEIQNNSLLINVFVKSGYKYYKKVKIITVDVINFYNWLLELDANDRVLIVENIAYKLRTIEIIDEEEELPF